MMANVALGPLVSVIRGSTGGGTWSNVLSGPTLRSRISPILVQSQAQKAVRSNLTAATRAWRMLTPVEQAAWVTYANTLTAIGKVSGIHYKPSAISVFTAYGAKLKQYNSSAVLPTTPPGSAYAGENPGISAVGGAGSITFSAAIDQTAGNVTELLYVEAISGTATYAQGDFLHLAWWTASSTTPDIVTLLPKAWKFPGVTILPGTYIYAWQTMDKTTGQVAQFHQGTRITVT